MFYKVGDLQDIEIVKTNEQVIDESVVAEKVEELKQEIEESAVISDDQTEKQ